MAIHSSILAWRIPWTEEPGGLQSIGSQRVRHAWSDLTHAHILWSHLKITTTTFELPVPPPPNLSGILLASIKSLWQWERCFECLGTSLAFTGWEALALKLPSWLTHGLLLELWTSYLTLILVFPSDNEPNAWLWGESLSAWGIICCVKEDSQLEAINSSKFSKGQQVATRLR